MTGIIPLQPQQLRLNIGDGAIYNNNITVKELESGFKYAKLDCHQPVKKRIGVT